MRRSAKPVSNGLVGSNPTDCAHSRASGLDWYDVSLTPRKSGVQVSPGPPFNYQFQTVFLFF